jgi:hypothetical protein
MNKKLFIPVLSITLLSLILTTTACVSTDHSRTAIDLQRAQGLYHGGEYRQAIASCDSIISTSAGSAPPTELVKVYQLRGECHKKLKDYTLARYDFEKARRLADSITPSTPSWEKISIECAIAAGDTFMHEGSFRIADRSFESLLAGSPPAELIDPLNYRRYICAIKLQKSDPARYLSKVENVWSIDVLELRKEFLGGARAPVASSKPAAAESPWSISNVKIIPRSTWRAAPTKANVTPMTTIRRITVHHTGMTWTSMDYNTTAAQILDYQGYHQDTRGWADLGYHFLVDRAGRIWEGRSLRYQGAHAGNSQLNRGNIGIALIGNYDEQTLYNLQKDALAGLLTILCREYGLSTRQITTHLELKNTACPGKHLQRFVEQFRTQALP